MTDQTQTDSRRVQHTPGPWEVIEEVNSRTGNWYIDTPNDTIGFEATGYANARLIAAAPDLLAALARFARWAERGSYPEIQGILTDAHEAIRKARGE